MKLADMSVKTFVDTLASNAPAPGGGSVSALAASNGCGLFSMVGELSVKKKKYKSLADDIKNRFEESMQLFKNNKDKFLDYIDEDTLVFNQLMVAFKLNKETDEEVKIRQVAIEKATMETIRVPMEVCQLALESLRLVSSMLPYANKNTLSDQGVGVLMLHLAIEGASMNVLINLSGLNEENLVKEYRKEIHLIRQEAHQLKDALLEQINL